MGYAARQNKHERPETETFTNEFGEVTLKMFDKDDECAFAQTVAQTLKDGNDIVAVPQLLTADRSYIDKLNETVWKLIGKDVRHLHMVSFITGPTKYYVFGTGWDFVSSRKAAHRNARRLAFMMETETR